MQYGDAGAGSPLVHRRQLDPFIQNRVVTLTGTEATAAVVATDGVYTVLSTGRYQIH